MTADARLHSQLEQRFYTGIWLGKDAQTNESILGIPGKIVRACTIRRQVEPEKYNRQLIDTAYIYPWNARWTVAASTFTPPPIQDGTAATQAAAMSTQTTEVEETLDAPGNHGHTFDYIGNITNIV